MVDWMVDIRLVMCWMRVACVKWHDMYSGDNNYPCYRTFFESLTNVILLRSMLFLYYCWVWFEKAGWNIVSMMIVIIVNIIVMCRWGTIAWLLLLFVLVLFMLMWRCEHCYHRIWCYQCCFNVSMFSMFNCDKRCEHYLSI